MSKRSRTHFHFVQERSLFSKNSTNPTNGKRAACNYGVMDARGRLLTRKKRKSRTRR